MSWDPRIHDENSERFYEPLPTAPKVGEKAGRERFYRRRKEFYAAMGWDEVGIPASETLKSLGLEDVDDALRRVRKR